MPNRSITIVRHGHREDFVGEEWGSVWSETAQFPHDPDLSARGVREAEALGKRLASYSGFTILSSPFLRTVHTASHIASALGTTVNIENGLHERMDPLGFPSFPNLRTLEQLQARFKNINADYKSISSRNYPETTFDDVIARTSKALANILARQDGDLILVTHADSLLGFLISAGIETCHQPVRTCSIYQIEGDTGNWTLTIDGETAHH